MKKTTFSLNQVWDFLGSHAGKKEKESAKPDFPDSLDHVVVKKEKISSEKRILEQVERKKFQPKKRSRTIIDKVEDEKNNFTNSGKTIVMPLSRVPFKEQDARFLRKLEKLSSTVDSRGDTLPSKQSVLRYINNLPNNENQPVYIDNNNAKLIAANRKYPYHQELSRSYIENFLREPVDDERPCCRPNCQSMEMGGFRCRELLMPGDSFHPSIAGWCYLCHLFETWTLYTLNLNPELKKYVGNKVYSIHHFIVKTDQIGEYRLDKTFQGDTNVVGIYGPVPIFNRNFYSRDTQSLVKRWKECDSLLFRLPPKTSDQTEFCLTTPQVMEN